MRHRPREIVREIEIADADGATVRAREPDEHPDRRRLSRAVGAEEAEDLSGAHVEGDIRYDLTLAEALRKAIGFEGALAAPRPPRWVADGGTGGLGDGGRSAVFFSQSPSLPVSQS